MLVQRDEAVAHERIQNAFVRFSQTIESYGGSTEEIRGDALVSVFPRASDAVSAALAFQLENSALNAELQDSIKPRIRIGISLGEVIVADNTITGAGVVLAQRLEQLAEPGGVVVQGSVAETVPNRLPFEFRSLGDHSLKGFDNPVRAFTAHLGPDKKPPEPEVEFGDSKDQSVATDLKPRASVPDIPSIVVLPFTNMSSDPEQEYFSDGVSEDIITDLSKLSGLFVIARNSAFAYKGIAPNIPDVCKTLGVRFALKGSIRKAGNRIRITAQLIDGVSGGHLWAERYDRDLTDIFTLQDEVTREIVNALSLKLTPTEAKSEYRQPTDNVEAYDYLLRGRQFWWRFTRQDNDEAKIMFQRAIDLDPDFASAYAWLAASHMLDCANDWSKTPDESQAMHWELVNQAASLEVDDAFVHVQMGMGHLSRGEYELAIKEGRKALSLDPSLFHAYLDLAWFLHYAGRSEEALGILDQVPRIDPHYPDVVFHARALCYFQLRKYDDAIANLQRRIRRKPDLYSSHALLAATYGHQGRTSEASAEWNKVLELKPDFSTDQRQRVLRYKNPADFDHYCEGLRKASMGVSGNYAGHAELTD